MWNCVTFADEQNKTNVDKYCICHSLLTIQFENCSESKISCKHKLFNPNTLDLSHVYFFFAGKLFSVKLSKPHKNIYKHFGRK